MKSRYRNIAVLTVLIFVALFCYASLQWRTVAQRETVHQIGMTLWFANQADFEAQRTTLALYQLADPKGGLTDVTASQALMRFEILLSRFELMQNPSQAEMIAFIDVASELQRTGALLDQIDQLLLTPTPQSAAEALPLQLDVSDLLHEVANKTAIADRTARQTARTERDAATRLLMISAFGVLLSGLTMAAMMLYSLRRAQAAQNALALHSDALEARIIERTAELEKALQQERRAKEVYRSFIVTISHQFRTPLAIIDMIVKRLVRPDYDQATEKTKAKLTRVLESSNRLTDLVNSFIDTANLDTHPKAYERTDVRLLPYLEDVLAIMRQRYPNRSFLLDVPPEAADLQFQGDKALLSRALLNIMQNSVTFSKPENPVKVFVKIELDSFLITVRDQGIGIPQDALAHVFEPYYRAENAHVLPGVGMGLSHSREIIQAHQGDILLLSQQEAGLDVTIKLPLPGRERHVEYP